MTTSKLQSLITEAVQLDRQVADLTDRLKEIKAELVDEAISRNEEQTPTDGGGASWSHEGHDGCIARVTFPAPSLKSKIDGGGKAISIIRDVTGKSFDALFESLTCYKPVDGFRDKAKELLGKSCLKLLRLVESKSPTTVSFETKQQA